MWAPLAEQVEVEWSRGHRGRPTGADPAQPGPARPDDTRRRRVVALGAAGGRRAATRRHPGSSAVLDYAFVLDGHEPALPDPRSAWQPHGVHGPSRTFDPARFAWTDDDWRGPRSRRRRSRLGASTSCTSAPSPPEGTLDAAVARLDHLVDLGVDVVELMPVAAFPGRWGWGYDGVDLYAVHDGYGGPAALAAVRRRLPRPRAGRRASTSCTTTSARAATTSRGSVPTSPRRTTPRGARRSTSTTRAPSRCDGSSSRTPCAGSATSTSTPCASTPSTSSRTTRRTHYLAELSDAVAAPGRRARPPPRPRGRERPQRHGRW